MKRLDETERFWTNYPSTFWSLDIWARLSGAFSSLNQEDYEKLYYSFDRLYQIGLDQQGEIRSEL